MAANSIIINIGARTEQASRDIKNFNSTLDGTKDSTGKLSKSLGGPLKMAAGIAATAIGATVGAMVNFGQAALEDRNEADLLAFTLDKIPGVTQKMIDANADWIDSMELATSVADTDLRDAVSKLALATGDLDEAQKLTALSADVAAGSGKELSGVSSALAKAVAGNTSALQRQFPWLDKDKDGTVSLAEATQGLTDKFGGAARAASNRDPFEKLKTIWGQLRESLGRWLLPVMDKFIEWFNKPENQRAIKDFIDKVADLSYKFGTTLVKAIEKVYKWLDDPDNVKTLKNFMGDLKDIARLTADAAGDFANLISKMEKVWDWGSKLTRLSMPAWLSGLMRMPKLPDLVGGGSNRSAAPRTSRAAGASDVSGVPYMVTDEQLARAVASLLMRSGVRNGLVAGRVL